MGIEIQVRVNPKLYLRDPLDTELGKNIVRHGILLLDEIGFENFTFKKLAKKIRSTEASVYRYFSSKHQFLSYLIAWYWSWMEYRLNFRTLNLTDPKEKLKVAVKVLTEGSTTDDSVPHVDEHTLHRVVVVDAYKAYVSVKLKVQSSQGLFESYEGFAKSLSGFISDYNSKFKYPMALATGVVNMAYQQLFHSEFFKDLTELDLDRGGGRDLVVFLERILFSVLDSKA